MDEGSIGENSKRPIYKVLANVGVCIGLAIWMC